MAKDPAERQRPGSLTGRRLPRSELTVICLAFLLYLAVALTGGFNGAERWTHRHAALIDEVLPLFGLVAACAGFISVRRWKERVKATARLADAERRYRLLLEQLPGAVYTDLYRAGIDAPEARFVSPRIEEMLGFSVQDWLDTPDMWARLLHPDDREAVFAQAADTERTETPFRGEYRMITKGGRVVWIREDASVIPMHDGARLWQGVMHDITAEKLERSAVEAIQARHQALIENASDATLILDGQGHVTYESPGAAWLLGSADPQREDDNPWHGIHPSDRSRVRQAFAECAEQLGAVVTWAHRVRDPAGRWRWVEVIAHNLLNEPMVGGIVINARDITDQRRSVDQLKLYVDVFNEISIGLYVFELEDEEEPLSLRVVQANDAATTATGVRSEEVIGKTIGEAFPSLVGTDIPAIYRRVALRGEGYKLPDVEYSDNRIARGVFSVYAFPLPDRSVGIAFENVTDRVTTELALRTTLKDLESVDQMRRRLLEHLVVAQESERERIANDIHDDPIQNMTAVQLRLGSIAISADTSSQQRKTLELAQETVGTSIKRLRSMLFELRPRALDSGHLLDAVRDYLANVRAFDDETTYILDGELEVEPNSTEATIAYRLIQEAVANARRHAQATTVRIRIDTRPRLLRIKVVDDGVGFNPGLLAADMPGHMGLSSMRQRAEMAGGTIQIIATPGRGVTVVAEIPLSEQGLSLVLDAR